MNTDFKAAIADVAEDLTLPNNILVVEDAEIENAFAKFAEPTPLNIAAWTALMFPKLRPKFLHVKQKAHDRVLLHAVALGTVYMTRFGEYSVSLAPRGTPPQAN